MTWLLIPVRASWQQPEQALSVQLRIHWVWEPGDVGGYELFEVPAKAESKGTPFPISCLFQNLSLIPLKHFLSIQTLQRDTENQPA